MDPRSARAAATLMQLLVEPPAEPPPEVEDEVFAEENEEARVTARQGTLTYVMNGAVALVAGLLLGVHSYAWLAAIVIPQWLAALFCWRFSFDQKAHAAQVVVIAAFAFLSIGADAGIAGPLVLVPAYAAAQVVVLSMSFVHRYRYLLLMLACLAVLVPLGLEYTGWITPAYSFADGRITISPRAVGLPPLALPLGAAAAVLTALIGPAAVTWRQGDLLRRLRRQNHLQAWTLRQLVPEHLAAPGPPKDEPGAPRRPSVREALRRKTNSARGVG